MFESRFAIFGFTLAIIIVLIMGFMSFHGPFGKVNKPAIAASNLAPVNVTIKTDPTAIGKYLPRTITVHVGQRVIFNNVSNAVHTVTASDGSFDSKDIAISGTWPLVPVKAGTYKYYCIYHPLMHGVLVVKS
jgi:plastocyanin